MKKATAKVSTCGAKEGLSPDTTASKVQAERREMARDLAILIRRKLRQDTLQTPPPTPGPRV